MRRSYFWRYLAIAAVFCLVCVIYLGRLFYIQISGKGNEYQSGTTVRTVTVQAVRGRILDREGRVLVSNAYTYDLTLSASSFDKMTSIRSNEICLRLLEAMSTCGEADKHVEKYFPMSGAYPYYRWSDEVLSEDSIPYYRLQRTLDDLGLKKDVTAQKLTDYYVRTYDLLSTDENGMRRFSDDEVDRLIRLRYDMDAMRFGAAADYVVAKDVGLPLMTDLKEQALGGVTFTVNAERSYAHPGYASHILGTVGPIYSEEWEYYNEQGYPMNAAVGKTGCEYAFESYLRGIDGEIEIREDAAGNILSVTVKKKPVAGSDIRLTIDIDLQIAAEDGLAENVQAIVEHSGGDPTRGSGCNAGAAVAMDPETFEILAVASYPTYDLSTYNADYGILSSMEGSPLLNRALSGSYAPGSTYKPGVAVAALMSGAIDVEDTLNCIGIYTRYADYQPKCSTVNTHRGSLDIIEAIADSCNVFFYEMGYRMGIDKMNEYMSAFGFGQPTGIELGGATGILAGPQYRQEVHGALWTGGNTLQAAIGQADNQATPLQLACYLSTLSNGGTRYSAHLLHSVYAAGADTPSVIYSQTSDTVLGRLEIPEDVRDSVFVGMRQMVTSHSYANRVFSKLPVDAGGKSGTAQTNQDCDNALFIGMAPYDNPEIVVSVVLEQGYSGERASLTAARIMEAYYGVEK